MLRRLFVKKCSTVAVVAFIVVAVTLALIGSIDDRDLKRHQVIGLYTIAHSLKDFATLKKGLYWPTWLSRANGTLRAGHC